MAVLSRPECERLATNLRVERDLLSLLEILSPLEVAVFKGPLLGLRLYGNWTARASADNDILVRSDQAPDALRRLTRAGYRALPGVEPERALTIEGQVELWPEGDLRRVPVDLHIRAFSGKLFEEHSERVWSEMEWLEIQGRSVRTFNAPLTLVHLVAHALAHHGEASHLRDVAQAWRRWGESLEVSSLQNLAEDTMGLRSFLFGLALAARATGQLFELAPFGAAVSAKASRLAAFVPLGNGRLLRAFVLFYAVGTPAALRGVGRGLFPRSDELSERYGPGPRFNKVRRHLLLRSRQLWSLVGRTRE